MPAGFQLGPAGAGAAWGLPVPLQLGGFLWLSPWVMEGTDHSGASRNTALDMMGYKFFSFVFSFPLFIPRLLEWRGELVMDKRVKSSSTCQYVTSHHVDS